MIYPISCMSCIQSSQHNVICVITVIVPVLFLFLLFLFTCVIITQYHRLLPLGPPCPSHDDALAYHPHPASYHPHPASYHPHPAWRSLHCLCFVAPHQHHHIVHFSEK
eukprot:1030826_1